MNFPRILFSVVLLVAYATSLRGTEALGPSPLHISGTQILTDRKEPVRLCGVNAASLEWTSDGQGHIVQTVLVGIRDWHANIIRLPLSQDRWFGKSPEQHDDGKSYRALVSQIVEICRTNQC